MDKIHYCVAITPYIPQVSPAEFIRQEVERGSNKRLTSERVNVVPPRSIVVTLYPLLSYILEELSRQFESQLTSESFRIMTIDPSPTLDFSRFFEPHSLNHDVSYSQPLLRINSPIPFRGYVSTNFNKKDIEEVQRAIINGVTNALTTIMSKDKSTLSGVWYPGDLHHFLESTGEAMPEDYWTGHADTRYFEKCGIYTFQLIRGRNASDAIEALFSGVSVLDCGNAIQLAYYNTLLEIIGKHKFDALFSGDFSRLTITQLGITDLLSPISYFADFTDAAWRNETGAIGKRPINVGEECHFKGIHFYANKHPRGCGSGWNVVYIGDNSSGEQLFIGHGFDHPLTEREINRLLVDLYNLERTEMDKRFIDKANIPDRYDKHVNVFLKSQYTVSIEQSDSAVEGFIVGTCKGLLPIPILLARTRPADCNLQAALAHIKRERLSRFFC
ncbi:MAG: hypothetical protein H7A37_10345 [Chlamydiales bacterium]|nr:hypothetical protein [Chlamydiia bacterium]MCP5508677.1 hypothetical protein [Chlamydiales bacterium]